MSPSAYSFLTLVSLWVVALAVVLAAVAPEEPDWMKEIPLGAIPMALQVRSKN